MRDKMMTVDVSMVGEFPEEIGLSVCWLAMPFLRARIVQGWYCWWIIFVGELDLM